MLLIVLDWKTVTGKLPVVMFRSHLCSNELKMEQKRDWAQNCFAKTLDYQIQPFKLLFLIWERKKVGTL